jgi:hypothetical protein
MCPKPQFSRPKIEGPMEEIAYGPSAWLQGGWIAVVFIALV